MRASTSFSEATAGRKCSCSGQPGSPGRGKIRTFVTFAIIARLTCPDNAGLKLDSYAVEKWAVWSGDQLGTVSAPAK